MRMTCNDSTSSRTLVQLAGGKFEGRSGRCLAGELLVVRVGSAATSTFSTISRVIVGLSAWKRQRRAVMLQSLSSLPSTRSSESISPGGRRRDVCRICRTVGIRRAGGRCNIFHQITLLPQYLRWPRSHLQGRRECCWSDIMVKSKATEDETVHPLAAQVGNLKFPESGNLNTVKENYLQPAHCQARISPRRGGGCQEQARG